MTGATLEIRVYFNGLMRFYSQLQRVYSTFESVYLLHTKINQI